MAKLLVLYYSSWGHMEKMAKAAAEGVRAAGAEVTVKRAAELVPGETARAAHYKLDQDAPVLTDPLELADYDGIIFGAPTRYGMMSAQMKNVLDQTGPLWAEGRLVGKVGSVMSSSATQHGGQEFDDPFLPHSAPAPWHGHRRPAIRLSGPDGHRRNQGRLPLWRHDDRRWRRRTTAIGSRTGRRALPRPPRRRDYGQARRLERRTGASAVAVGSRRPGNAAARPAAGGFRPPAPRGRHGRC